MKDYSSYGRKKQFVTNRANPSLSAASTQRLNVRLRQDAEFAANYALERTKTINAKSFRRAKRKPTRADYRAALADFAETEDCSPVETLALNPRCIEIARQHGKTPEEVAADINRVYIDSYKPVGA
jgi:hypothetical protein